MPPPPAGTAAPHPSPPPDDLAGDVNDRELRLTALVNVLGFPSLDDLEDFVFLHGAARVVPAAQRDTLPLDDTQTQYSETRHARRNEERRLENAQLRRDLARAEEELVWTRAEVAKERTGNAALVKDKQRLLDLVEDLRRTVAQPPPTIVSRSSPGSSSQAMPLEVELSHCWEEISTLEATVGALEEDLLRANQGRDEHEAELRDLREELARLQQDQARGEAAETELAAMKERLNAVIPVVLGSDKASSASPSVKAPPALPVSPRPPPASAASGLPRAPPTPRRHPASTVLSPHPNRSSRSGSTSASATPKPLSQPSAPASSALPERPPAPTPSAAVPPQLPSATALTTSTQAGAPPVAHPRVVVIASDPPSSAPAPFAPSPSSSASAAIQEARAQISLFPVLHASYHLHRTAVHALQASLPLLQARIDALPAAETAPWRAKHGAAPVLGPAALTRFAPIAPLPEDARERRDMAREGTLGEKYRDMEAKERELVAVEKIMRAWEKSAKKACKRFEGAPGLSEAGTPASGAVKKREAAVLEAPSTGATATPSAQPVKKRRRVVKDVGATPATGASAAGGTPAPAKAVHSPVQAQALASATGGATPTPQPAAAASPRKRSPPSARGATPPFLAAGSPKTSGKKARWNLISPTKRSRVSPHRASGSGLKAQLWRAAEVDALATTSTANRGAVLVDETQPILPLAVAPAPALPRRLSSEADRDPSTYEAEPDTIRTDAASSSQHQQRLRTSSRSPQKPTPRRAPSVAPRPSRRQHAPPAQATDADDPFVAHPLPLQPSPNARTARRAALAASPSASPTPSPGKSLEMPPSAQPGSRTYRSLAARAGADAQEDEDERAFRSELRFFGGLGTPPLAAASPSPQQKSAARAKKGKKRAKEEEAVVAVKPEDDLDADEAGLAPVSPPKKKQRRAKAPKMEEREKLLEEEEEEEEEGDGNETRWMTQPFPDGPGVTEKEKKDWIAGLRSKRKARMAAEEEKRRSGASSSKRKQLEVNPDRNKGEAHLFKDVERRKKERQKMLAEPCQQCVEYFARADKPVQCFHVHQDGPPVAKRYLDLRAEEQAERLQNAGRHRVQQRTEKEPPDYWQMGMPSSGRVEEINRRAKAQNEERRAYQEKEAQLANGVYRYRTFDDDQ
ncbi:hypothetical protein JCM10450v2_001658 [Rhodotorula kratochvilovae]